MHQPQDTLHHMRHSVLLRHSSTLWLSSAALAVACVALMGLPVLAPGLALIALSGLGLVTVHYGRERLQTQPGWNPTLTIGLLAFLQGLIWAYLARQGGLCLILALAFTGLAGVGLFAHWRAMMAAWVPVAVAPLLFPGGISQSELLELHLPVAILILIGGWQGYRVGQRFLENAFENHRLNDMLMRHRDQLEATVEQRTAELVKANERLNDEIELRKHINHTLMKSEEQLNLAMTASGIGFWDWDLVHRRVHHSDRQRFFGQGSEESELVDLEHRVERADRAAVRHALTQHLRGRTQYYHARYRIRHPDASEPVWLEDSGKVIERDAKGRAVRMVGTRRDISADMRLQEELRMSSTLFNNSPDGVFLLDRDQCLRTCNRMFNQIIRRQKGQLIGLSLFQVLPTDQQTRIAKGMVNNDHWEGDIVAVRGDHERFPMSLKLTAIRSPEGQVSHYLGICRDLTEHRRHALQLDYLQNYDKLTGLFNRGYFHRLLKQLEDDGPLRANHYAVAVLNLDRFKAVNDRLGQDVGDQLLRDVAARLNNLSDPVRQVARLGSDEFALLIEFEGDREALMETLSLALSELSRPCLINEHELMITASAGACIVHQGNTRQLLNQAIAAMNMARQQGGNRIQLYQGSLASLPAERDRLKADLQQAVTDQALQVVYQPKLNLSTGMIDSVEALARWKHASQGWIDPEVFIPLAQETGLISPISYLMLDRACRDAAEWQRGGHGEVRVAVNLSNDQLYNDDFCDHVSAALDRHGLAAPSLELELTESMLMEDVAHTLECLNRLHALGVHLTLDDFGTGYSSLNSLKRFPIDTLKIDRSFLGEISAGAVSPVIEAIMAMAASLKMAVVGEGVETREQFSYLKRLGCHSVQGYLISRPLPAADIVPLIRHSGHRLFAENEPEQLH